MRFVFLWLVVFLQQNSAQHAFDSIPSNFDSMIRHLRHQYEIPRREFQSSLDSFSPWNEHLTLQLVNQIVSKNQTDSCERDLINLVQSASEHQLWALKILDSWGKPLPSGLLKGNLLWTGNYDECLNPLYQYENKTFLPQPLETKYCTLITNPSKAGSFLSSNIVIGLCLPATCNYQTLKPLLDQILNNTNITEPYVNCPNDPEHRKNDRSAGITITLTLLCLLALLVFFGTIADLLFRFEFFDQTVEKKSVHLKTLAEFSAIRTLEQIFKIENKENSQILTFINGLRVLALFWIIFGHSFLFGIYYTSNASDVLAWSHNFAFQLISSGVLSVDTFFLLSGFLTTVLFLRETKKERLSPRLMFLYYIHRYIRLTPTFIMIMLINMFLSPYFGHGPLYPSQQGFESDECLQKYWWTSFFYIGNLVKPDGICLSVSWYLFNDMQFHWVAPLALIPFAIGRKKLAFFVAVAFVFISVFSIIGLLLYYPQIFPNMIRGAIEQTAATGGPTFYNTVYTSPWCRIAPYAIGILTGFLVAHMGPTCTIQNRFLLIGTIISIGLGFTCIFATYQDYTLITGLPRASIIGYEALSRPAWSLSIAWLVFVCSLGHGGIINRFLSLSIWSPLTRLNYATYLFHLSIIYITIFNQTMPFYYQPLTVLNNFVSQLFFSYLAAVPIVIIIETPFVVIEKKLFKRNK